MATTLTLVETFKTTTRKSGDISYIVCRIILDGVEQNASFKSHVGDEPIVIGEGTITVSEDQVQEIYTANQWQQRMAAERDARDAARLADVMSDIDGKLEARGASPAAREAVGEYYRANVQVAISSLGDPAMESFIAGRQKIIDAFDAAPALLAADSADMTDTTILDALAVEIRDTREAIAAIANPDRFAPITDPAEAILTAQLDGLYRAFTSAGVEYLIDEAARIAAEHGHPTDYEMPRLRAFARQGVLTSDGIHLASHTAETVAWAAWTAFGWPSDSARLVMLGCDEPPAAQIRHDDPAQIVKQLFRSWADEA